MRVEPPRVASRQQVRNQVGRVESGVRAPAHVVGHGDGRRRHVAFDLLAARFGLCGFLRDRRGVGRAVGEGCEPLFGQFQHPFLLDVRRDRQHGVRRAVVGAVEGLHLFERRSGNVVGRKADGRPAVGVDLVGQRPQQHRLVAVRLVEVTLAELLDHHFFLGFEFRRGDVQSLHAVAFEPEGRLDVVLRERDVEIRIVVVREGVVVARGHLHREVEIGDLARAAEHQVLEQVGESRAPGIFVARSDLVEDVHGGEFRGPVAVDDDGEAVRQYFLSVWNHNLQKYKKAGTSAKPGCVRFVKTSRSVKVSLRHQKYKKAGTSAKPGCVRFVKTSRPVKVPLRHQR